jgi:hypothetical protein
MLSSNSNKIERKEDLFLDSMTWYLFPIEISICCIGEFIRITGYDNTIACTKINRQEIVKQKSKRTELYTLRSRGDHME